MTREQYVERNAKIAKLRESGLTLEDVGHQFGISRERVRQIVIRVEAGPKERRTPRNKRCKHTYKAMWDNDRPHRDCYGWVYDDSGLCPRHAP